MLRAKSITRNRSPVYPYNASLHAEFYAWDQAFCYWKSTVPLRLPTIRDSNPGREVL